MLIEYAEEKGYCPNDKNSIESVIETVHWVNTNLLRKKWNSKEIRELYGRRNSKEILEQGHINFFVPCIDLSSVVGQLLNESGFNIDFVLHESRSFFEPLFFHSRLEVKTKEGEFGLDNGRYGLYYYDLSKLRHRHKYIHRKEFSKIDSSKPVLESMTDGGIDNMRELFPGYNHTLWMLDMRCRNTDITYNSVKKELRKRQDEKEHNFKIPIKANLRFAR